MSRRFSLGSFGRSGAKPFVGLLLDQSVVDLSIAGAAIGLGATRDLLSLLQDWDRNLEALHRYVDSLGTDGLPETALSQGELAVLAPIPRPPKILNSAANYSGHVKEMKTYTHSGGDFDQAKSFAGDKAKSRPYMFFKAPSCVVGPYDDVVLPRGEHNIDWEAEMAVVIGRNARYVSAASALEHVAGYMIANDVTCRDTLFREDRQTFRTDWMASKSHDTFLPTGPFFVPREFIAHPGDIGIELRVNGEVKQSGSTAEMIFSAEEQIEYASAMMTLEPGDLFITGTTSGVGESSGTYLKAGDLVETALDGLGQMRNRVVAGD